MVNFIDTHRSPPSDEIWQVERRPLVDLTASTRRRHMKVLNLLRQRSFHLIHLLPFLCHEVAANTEIINFSSSRELTVDLPLDVVGNWCVSYHSKLG